MEPLPCLIFIGNCDGTQEPYEETYEVTETNENLVMLGLLGIGGGITLFTSGVITAAVTAAHSHAQVGQGNSYSFSYRYNF